MTDIGRDDITKAVRELHHRLSGNRKKDSTLAMPAMLCSPAARWWPQKRRRRRCPRIGGGHGKGKGGRREKQGLGGKGTNEDGGGSAAAAGGDGSSAKAGEGSTSEVRCYRCGKKSHWRVE